MIREYNLEILCNKYNLSKDKIITKNNNILIYGEYVDIDNTLNYLINNLHIDSRNIEKCPSILYRNVNEIKDNILFLKSKNISFTNIETCLHVLSSEQSQLKLTYEYIENNYGYIFMNKNTSVLSVPVSIIKEVEKFNLKDKTWNISIAVAIKWGSTTIEEIQKIIQSKEYKEHPELFTSETLAHAKLEEIQKIIQSKEYQEHPEMFTSTTLAHAKLEEIQKIIQSKEYQEHPELFTSETLAHAKLEEIQKIIQSKEYKEHPEMFTSTTLARAKLEDIQKIIQSKEYQEHPELFTSETLAHAKLEEIQKIIQSKEYKEHPELFTSETLAHAKLEEIQQLLNMDIWLDPKYKKILTSSVVAKSKIMISKLPILVDLAERYGLSEYLNTSFILFSPSQNYALIKYLEEKNMPLIVDEKLNPIFGKQPGVLRKKYGIDIKEYMIKYPIEELEFGGKLK